MLDSYTESHQPICATKPSLSIEDGDSDDGVFYGIGMDYMVTDTVSVGAEVLRHEFDINDDGDDIDLDITTIGLNVAYNF